MSADIRDIPLYEVHTGTIKIAGDTQPKAAGWCAFRYLQRQLGVIEFLCIGANANQQATKAMSIFRYIVSRAPECSTMEVAFQPFMYKAVTTNQLTGETKEKTVTVWRTVIVAKS